MSAFTAPLQLTRRSARSALLTYALDLAGAVLVERLNSQYAFLYNGQLKSSSCQVRLKIKIDAYQYCFA